MRPCIKIKIGLTCHNKTSAERELATTHPIDFARHPNRDSASIASKLSKFGRRILEGETAGAVRVASESGLAALRIPVSALPRPEIPPDRPLGLCAVFDRLRLSHAAELALVDSAFGKAHLPVR